MQQRYTYRKPDNLVELFETAVERFSYNDLFGQKNGGGTIRWMTYQQVGDRVDDLRAGLSGLGVGAGDRVGIISNNRPEWAIAAFATYGLGARFVPMYEAELEKTWRYVIRDAGIKVLFVSKPGIFERLRGWVDEIDSLERIVLIAGEGEGAMAELEARGSRRPVPSVEPTAEDVAVLIYTSGTTGEPKGVLLSHGNLTHCARAGYHRFPELDEGARSLSILPWAHSYGQVAELYNWLQFGGSIGFMERVETLADDLVLFQPTFLLAVPRIFNKIYGAVWAKMRDEGGAKLKLFEAALKVARRRRELREAGRPDPLVELQHALFDRLVLSKLRDRFGGRVQAALTASATMNPEVSSFFFDVGVPVYDCYGLTETSPAVTMNCPASYRIGTVGGPIDRVKVVIDHDAVELGAEDGEVIVYGPNVMQGYHNKPEETARVMTPDGGFRTGDRGRLDDDGFLRITGRLKEQFKLENGKYVFPAEIEEEIMLLPAVANAMIYGDGRPQLLCLVYPDFEVLAQVAHDRGIVGAGKELTEHPRVREYLEREIKTALAGKFGGYEIPRKFLVLTEDFTVDNGMLTQTMKLKRRTVLDRYKDAIEALYRS